MLLVPVPPTEFQPHSTHNRYNDHFRGWLLIAQCPRKPLEVVEMEFHSIEISCLCSEMNIAALKLEE